MPYTTGRFTVDQLEFIQSVPVSVLSAVAAGQLDLNRLAREELANRGYDQAGVWVGFGRALDALSACETEANGFLITNEPQPAPCSNVIAGHIQTANGDSGCRFRKGATSVNRPTTTNGDRS